MNEKSCPPTTNGQQATVKIPDGLPALMMVIAREVLRHAPEDECTAYSIVADYLKNMIKENLEKDKASPIDNEWTREMLAQNVIETVEKYGVTTDSANHAATLIQRAWRKFNKSLSESKQDTLDRGDHIYATEFEEDTFEEFYYENDLDDDDMERVNVVRKGQRDYVPPIPDFIDDLYSLQYEENANDQRKETSYEDEE